MIRLNVSALMIFKLKNMKDSQALLEETSALINKKRLMGIYEKAIEQNTTFYILI